MYMYMHVHVHVHVLQYMQILHVHVHVHHVHVHVRVPRTGTRRLLPVRGAPRSIGPTESTEAVLFTATGALYNVVHLLYLFISHVDHN